MTFKLTNGTFVAEISIVVTHIYNKYFEKSIKNIFICIVCITCDLKKIRNIKTLFHSFILHVEMSQGSRPRM